MMRLKTISILGERIAQPDRYPFNIPTIASLKTLEITSANNKLTPNTVKNLRSISFSPALPYREPGCKMCSHALGTRLSQTPAAIAGAYGMDSRRARSAEPGAGFSVAGTRRLPVQNCRS